MSVSMLTMLGALGAELLLVVLVLLTVSWLRNRAARRRDLQAIQKLVERVKARKPEREKAIGDFLEQRAGLSGESLGEAQTALLSAELVLLHRFAITYSSRDAAAATRFDDDVVAALQSYNDLAISAQSESVGAEGEAGLELADSVEAELEVLRKENQRLSEQLQVGMDTMSRMVNEYSSMFDGAEQDADKPTGAAPAVAAMNAETATASAEEAPEEAASAEAEPAVAQTADSDTGPESETGNSASTIAEDASEPAGAPDALAVAEPEQSVAEATADAEPTAPTEPPSEEPVAAASEDDSVDLVSNDPASSAQAATGDEVALTAPESDSEQAIPGKNQDEIEVQGGMPEDAEVVEPAADEATDGQVESVVAQTTQEEGGDVEVNVDQVDLDVAEQDSALPKAQTGS